MSDPLSMFIKDVAEKEAALLDELVSNWCAEHGRWPAYAWIVTAPVGGLDGPLSKYKIEARCSDVLPKAPPGAAPIAVYDLRALNRSVGEA